MHKINPKVFCPNFGVHFISPPFLFLILGIECSGTAYGNGQKNAAEIIAGV